MRKSIMLLSVLLVTMYSCTKPVQPNTQNITQPQKVTMGINKPVKLVRGQNLYLPVYSTIPYNEGHNFYNLSAFVAVHNTDFTHTIYVKKVYYFNNDGNLVQDFLKDSTVELKPLSATNFFIPESDKSGIGANFIIEWTADTLVNEPLIESIMVSLTQGQGVSFSSLGKVINEISE
jgi:hypothetical protein